MNSTTVSGSDTQSRKSLGLENAVSPFSLLVLVSGQIYLFWLVASSRSTFTQAMLMTCVECLCVWLLTTLFFSRTWSGFFSRCRELLIMAIVLMMLLAVFAYLDLAWAPAGALMSFDEMRAALTVARFQYGLAYILIMTLGWLVMAWQSGQARIWWAANVAAPASATFAAMFMALAAGWILIFVPGVLQGGLDKIGVHVNHIDQALRDIAPMVLLIVYCLTRIVVSWKMAAIFTPEDWRKIEAKFYFDAV